MKPEKVKRDVHLTVPPMLAAAIDEWRLKTQHLGTRPEAIRKLVEIALGLDAKGKKVAA